jgi:hypothetical protein
MSAAATSPAAAPLPALRSIACKLTLLSARLDVGARLATR